MKTATHYINTDLELVAEADLAPLADALTSRGLIPLSLYQHDALWYASFETGEGFDHPEPNIAAFLTALESLDTASNDLWSACMGRTVDIGFKCGDEPHGFRSHLTAPTLARLVAAGASLHLTLYPWTRFPGDAADPPVA